MSARDTLRPISWGLAFSLLTASTAMALTATPSVSTPTSTPTAAPSCPPCFRIGYVSVLPPEVDPPQPRVGDTVTLSFPLDYYAAFSFQCSSSACLFGADSTYLEGDEEPSFDFTASRIVVRRRAIAAGIAAVSLDVSALTEDQCYYMSQSGDCSLFFTYATIRGTSGEQLVEISVGPPLPPTPTTTPTVIPERCVGDCDADGEVRVDELVRMINIALGRDPGTCAAGDHDGNLMITVDEISGAINAILDGCGFELADLAAVSARPTGCVDGSCGPYDFEVCIENRGAAVSRDIAFSLSQLRYSGVLESLARDSAACVHVPYGTVQFGDQSFEVDPDHLIPDRDRGNNTITFPAPNPTGCDAICPPTPEPQP